MILKKEKHSQITIVILYIYGFLLFYRPPLEVYFIISSKFIMFVIFILNIICNFNYLFKLKLYAYKKYILLYAGIVFAIVYYSTYALTIGNTDITIDMMSIVYLTNLLFLIKYLKNVGYGGIKSIVFLLNIMMIQGIITVLMIIVPDVRNIALDLYLYGKSDVIRYTEITNYRVYGITGDYTYITPIFHGLLGIVAAVCSIYYDKSFLKYIPFSILLILLNGRTGIVVIFIGTGIAYFILLISNVKVKKIIGYAILFMIMIILLINIIAYVSPKTFEWIISGFNNSVDFIYGNEMKGNYKILNRMLYFPENMVFGEGYSVYGSKALERGYMYGSDIGFVNDLFRGGLIYVVILYGAYVYFLSEDIITKKSSSKSKLNVALTISFLVTLVIANYKGECMHGSNLLCGMIFVKLSLLESLQNNGTIKSVIRKLFMCKKIIFKNTI